MGTEAIRAYFCNHFLALNQCHLALATIGSKDLVGSDNDDALSDSDDDENKSNTGRVSGVEDEDDLDEEMDGGTDYASNYFDNGEGYEDGDDDNLDEGGIY